MDRDLNYIDVIRVVESWELIKRIPDYQEKIGTMLFTKLVELEPDTKKIFEFNGNNYEKNNNYFNHIDLRSCIKTKSGDNQDYSCCSYMEENRDDDDDDDDDDVNIQFVSLHGCIQHRILFFVQMINTTLCVLGPDLDVVTEILSDFTLQHLIKHGIKVDIFQKFFCKALVETVEQLLGPNHRTNIIKKSWHDVFNVLAIEMNRIEQRTILN